MLEAFGFAIQMFFAASLIFLVVFSVRIFFAKSSIPQKEIDAEARRLIVQYGDGAVEAAEGRVLRSQWAKGKNDSRERSEQVLKAVRAKITK